LRWLFKMGSYSYIRCSAVASFYRAPSTLLTSMPGRSRQQQPAPPRVLRLRPRRAARVAVQG
jgi:hypothetical protein